MPGIWMAVFALTVITVGTPLCLVPATLRSFCDECLQSPSVWREFGLSLLSKWALLSTQAASAWP